MLSVCFGISFIRHKAAQRISVHRLGLVQDDRNPPFFKGSRFRDPSFVFLLRGAHKGTDWVCNGPQTPENQESSTLNLESNNIWYLILLYGDFWEPGKLNPKP